MSKIKLLLDVVQDMCSLADSLQTSADSLQSGTPEQSSTMQPTDHAESPKHTAPKITIDQLRAVRAVRAEKNGEGKTAQGQALLNKYAAEFVFIVCV